MDARLLEVVDKLNGVEPGGASEEDGRAFFPVTRRDRLICCLLAAIIIVAVANIGTSLFVLIEGGSPGTEDVEVSMSQSEEQQSDDLQMEQNEGSVEYNEIAKRARTNEHDGVIEVPLDEIYGQEINTDEQLSDINGGAQKYYTANSKKEVRGRFAGAVLSRRGRISETYGCGVSEKSKISVKSSSILRYGGINCYSDDSGKSKGNGRIQRQDGTRNDADIASDFEDYQTRNIINYRDYHSSGVYRLGDSDVNVNHQAMWLGGVGVKTWSKLYTAFARSAVGQKIKEKGLAPLLTFMIGFGGYTAADAELAAISAEERVMMAETSTALTNAAIEADVSEIAYAASSRVVYNAANGIEMNAAEVAQATAQDIITACEVGELPTAANATWETGLADLMAGGMPVEWTQPFAAYGESMLDFFNLEHPESAVELKPYDDAPVSVESGQSVTASSYYPPYAVVDETLPSKAYRYYQNGNPNSPVTNYDCVIHWGVGSENDEYYFCIKRENGKTVSSGVISNAVAENLKNRGAANRFSPQCKIYYYGTVKSSSMEPYSIGNGYSALVEEGQVHDGDGKLLSGIIDEVKSVFNSGYQIVGNDAQFGDDGNLVDAGTVNVLDPISHYENNGESGGSGDEPVGYGSWAELMEDAGASAVKPADPVSGVNASDNFYKPGENQGSSSSSGENQGGDTGENQGSSSSSGEDQGSSTGENQGGQSGEDQGSSTGENTGESGDTGDKEPDTIGEKVEEEKSKPPNESKLRTDLSVILNDLGNKVSGKFPFSVPANVSSAVGKLKAEPEAPHFTWVFELPTGRQELEVSLKDFDPVASVLRLTLDVLLVFAVISLLGKIAQVWGFFDKAVD